MKIKENIAEVKRRIFLTCTKINCDPRTITLVAVSKGRSIDEIKQAIEAGITHLGENRVQEAVIKYAALRNTEYGIRINWHMVGHLQTNKVKDAVKIFDLIHSIDSLPLAKEVDKQANKLNKIQDVLIEIKTSPEISKFGFNPEQIIEVIKEISGFKNINIKGLMTIAPRVDDPEQARPYFRRLRGLLEEINTKGITQQAMRILSMGMTEDFEVALEEGANMLRLGRAIFEGQK
ncbi:MAG: YggS family pyridoxal phosphate-dependent enzyme [Candidatus Omnitrophica bacterium]|nr:YggS family pyridoxal phosphate-dependent enzyme [Candidatus Omnitrophota bacterium]